MEGASHVNVLIIGRPGVGKSQLANTLSGTEAFLALPSCTSVTSIHQSAPLKLSGVEGTVVDTRGLQEPYESITVRDSHNAAIASQPHFHIIFWVVSAGRFTEADYNAFQFAKNAIYGPSFLPLCTLLITHCDEQNLSTQEEQIKYLSSAQDNQWLAEVLSDVEKRVVFVSLASAIRELETQREAWRVATKEELRKLIQQYSRGTFSIQEAQAAQAEYDRKLEEEERRRQAEEVERQKKVVEQHTASLVATQKAQVGQVVAQIKAVQSPVHHKKKKKKWYKF